MEAKQIENQINANQNEAMRIQSQLLQMDFSNPQYQPLSNRLTIINRAQTYWSNEYLRLTGKRIAPSASATVTPAPALPSAPSSNPVQPIAPTLKEWKEMRLKLRTSLLGNPNFARVENYLVLLEKNAGNGVPVIPGTVGFGKFRRGTYTNNVEDLNGSPMKTSSCAYIEDSAAIVLFENGATVRLAEGNLIVFYPTHNQNQTLPKVEINRPDLVKAFKALRGE